MRVKNVGKRGILFSFDELLETYKCVTNVYVINGDKSFIICDTYIGSTYMDLIKGYLESHYTSKEYIVFNSHGHWDHVWGNSSFGEGRIIAHNTCLDYILENGEKEYGINKDEFAKEEIDIVLPNLVFDSKMELVDEGVVFFYSPGHSLDSASCYDKVDNILFVGDNMDDPIPSYICWNNLKAYRDTLDEYIRLNPNEVVQSHGDVMCSDMIRKNKEYIIGLIEDVDFVFEDSDVIEKHKSNINYLKG